MPSRRQNVFETIRNKRQWHTPPDPQAAKLGFRGWHSRGYLPHFDMPGLVQFISRLWQDDYWDRYIRDDAHFRKVVHYIETNPVKAGLAQSPEQWPFSSARFRDEHYHLRIRPKSGTP